MTVHTIEAQHCVLDDFLDDLLSLFDGDGMVLARSMEVCGAARASMQVLLKVGHIPVAKASAQPQVRSTAQNCSLCLLARHDLDVYQGTNDSEHRIPND